MAKRVFPPEWYAAQAARRKNNKKRSEVNQRAREGSVVGKKSQWVSKDWKNSIAGKRAAITNASVNKYVADAKKSFGSMTHEQRHAKLTKDGFTSRNYRGGKLYKKTGMEVRSYPDGHFLVSRKTGQA